MEEPWRVRGSPSFPRLQRGKRGREEKAGAEATPTLEKSCSRGRVRGGWIGTCSQWACRACVTKEKPSVGTPMRQALAGRAAPRGPLQIPSAWLLPSWIPTHFLSWAAFSFCTRPLKSCSWSWLTFLEGIFARKAVGQLQLLLLFANQIRVRALLTQPLGISKNRVSHPGKEPGGLRRAV